MYKQLLTYEIRAQVRSDVRILAALVAVVAASIGVRALDIPGLGAPLRYWPMRFVSRCPWWWRLWGWLTTGKPSTASAATSP